MTKRGVGNQLAMGRDDRARQEDEATVRGASKGVDCGLNFGGAIHRRRRDFDAHARRHLADCAQVGVPGRMIEVLQYSYPRNARHRLLEHLQPFPRKRVLEDSKARDVAAWTCKTCNEAVSDWIG